MNERIRELWSQCVIKHTKIPMNWQDVADEFAELIIRECANRIDYWESRQGEHSDDLLKHFGVEE